MMATILNSSIFNSAILDSAILLKTLTQTSSIWLKLIHSDSTWWWQPSWILPSWIQPFCKKKNFTHSFWLNLMIPAILISAILNSAILYKKKLHSFILTQLGNGCSSWTLLSWFQTLPSWIETPCYLLSDSLKNTLTPFWLWLKLIHSDSNSFILT